LSKSQTSDGNKSPGLSAWRLSSDVKYLVPVLGRLDIAHMNPSRFGTGAVFPNQLIEIHVILYPFENHLVGQTIGKDIRIDIYRLTLDML
jgi:hypothetical protein